MRGDCVGSRSGRTWGLFAWLPLVIPLAAERFSTDDERVAATLIAAGGSIDDDSPDLEVLADPRNARARAPRVVTWLGAPPADTGPWFVRRGTRVVRGLELRIDGARAARRLRRHAYSLNLLLPWEPEGAYAPSLAGWRRHRTLADILPENLLVVGDRGSRPCTLVDAALEHSSRHLAGGPLEIERLLVRDTSLVVVDRRAVLRVGFGGSASGVERQVDALARLRNLDALRAAAAWTPQVLGHGKVGLGAWSLEDRLPGAAMDDGNLDAALVDDCIDFLVDLGGAWRGPVDPSLLAGDGEVVMQACDGPVVEHVRSLTGWIAARVSVLPGCLAHGDFFGRNILVDGGRLAGVVDWERSIAGRPMLHDVVHYRIAEQSATQRSSYGRAAVMWAESAAAGSDAFLGRYCRRLGLEPDEATMVAVAGGCWLAQVAHQLSRVAENGADRAWLATNVTDVALELHRVAARVSG